MHTKESTTGREDCTDLVVYPLGGIGQLDALLEPVADLFHLLALAPVIKGPCNVDLVAGVRPVMPRDGRVSLGAPIELRSGHCENQAVLCSAGRNCHSDSCPRAGDAPAPGAMIAVVVRASRSNRLVGARRDGGALSLSSIERHGRGELVKVVDGSELALALADYGAPRVGCAEAC